MQLLPLLLGILPLILPLLVAALNISSTFHTSSKRGLVYIPNSDFPEDDDIWIRKGSDLTWYYNYKMYPSLEYINHTQLEFIPMLWGAPPSFSDTSFLENVTAQIEEGRNITYVMGFNEPDNTGDTGGSNIKASDAARYWKKQLEPLRKLGVSLGAPGVTGGSSGFTWLSDFEDACDGGCTFDFIPIHWYGSFDGMASHIKDVLDLYPDKKIWVTEFALNNADLNETQDFFQTALDYLDKNEYVDPFTMASNYVLTELTRNVSHYSYFGAFRSFTSNVGINVAFLNSYGKLTDIGSWYLGGNATGVKPDNVTVEPTHPGATGAMTPTYTVPPLVTELSGATSVSAMSFLSLLTISILAM